MGGEDPVSDRWVWTDVRLRGSSYTCLFLTAVESRLLLHAAVGGVKCIRQDLKPSE